MTAISPPPRLSDLPVRDRLFLLWLKLRTRFRSKETPPPEPSWEYVIAVADDGYWVGWVDPDEFSDMLREGRYPEHHLMGAVLKAAMWGVGGFAVVLVPAVIYAGFLYGLTLALIAGASLAYPGWTRGLRGSRRAWWLVWRYLEVNEETGSVTYRLEPITVPAVLSLMKPAAEALTASVLSGFTRQEPLRTAFRTTGLNLKRLQQVSMVSLIVIMLVGLLFAWNMTAQNSDSTGPEPAAPVVSGPVELGR